MGGLKLSRPQRASPLFAFLLGTLTGCSNLDFREVDQSGGAAMGGDPGGAGSGGASGASGRGGASGQSGGAGSPSGGMGGTGASTFNIALKTCLEWCRNEPAGPSCCDPFTGTDCLRDCYDRCDETVADQVCIEEWIAARQCEVEAECDPFFGECAEPALALMSCEFRIEAEEEGSCASVDHGCAVTEEECFAALDVGDTECVEAWRRYSRCVDTNGHLSCEECADNWLRDELDCVWPDGAAEESAFVPSSCDTLPVKPRACFDPCPAGLNSECGPGTFCEGRVCEAECVSNRDCRRGDACNPHGRCFRTMYGNPLDCALLSDPPVGCGVDCSDDPGACPSGTSCWSGVVCDTR